jgi:hypothetical protein
MSAKNLGTLTGTSPAESAPAAADAAAASLGTVAGLAKYDLIQVYCEVQGATGGTLDLYLQTSFDEGTTWWDWAHLDQLSAAAAAVKYVVQPSTSTAILTIGKGSSPALAAGEVCGPWGNLMRVWMVPGASTSAGAAQSFTFYGYTRPL